MTKIICCHTGIGDFMEISSAIKQLAEKELVVIPLINMVGNFPFPERKKQNVLSFFDGINVKFLDWKQGTDVFDFIERWNATGLGWYSFRGCKPEDFHIEEHMKFAYEKLGCDYKSRGNLIPEQAKKIKQLPVPEEPYAFIPEGGSTGQFKIDRKYIKGLKEIVPPQDALLLEWVDIINNATEIHSHDCGWWSLINMIPTKSKPFFHLYARPECRIYDYEKIYLKEWEVIK